jgi:hypothetical protein
MTRPSTARSFRAICETSSGIFPEALGENRAATRFRQFSVLGGPTPAESLARVRLRIGIISIEQQAHDRGRGHDPVQQSPHYRW